jgi:hypothetical protein
MPPWLTKVKSSDIIFIESKEWFTNIDRDFALSVYYPMAVVGAG